MCLSQKKPFFSKFQVLAETFGEIPVMEGEEEVGEVTLTTAWVTLYALLCTGFDVSPDVAEAYRMVSQRLIGELS